MGTLMDDENRENLRTEYTALSSYHQTVASFRFTTLGFYLAAVGLIVSGQPTKGKALLLLGLSITLYMVELRNRSLVTNIAQRGVEIERDYWGYNKVENIYRPFYSHMMKTKPTEIKSLKDVRKPSPDYPKVWKKIVPFAISHTIGLDILYLVVTIYCLFQVILAKTW